MVRITLDEEDFMVLVNGGAVIRPRLQIMLEGVEFEAMDEAIARARHNRHPWPGGCGPECAPSLEEYSQPSGMYYLCFTHARPVPTLWTAAARAAALAGQVPEYEGRAKTYQVYGESHTGNDGKEGGHAQAGFLRRARPHRGDLGD